MSNFKFIVPLVSSLSIVFLTAFYFAKRRRKVTDLLHDDESVLKPAFKRSSSVYQGTNEVPITEKGTVIHVDVAPGQVAPRIVTVGAESRAITLAMHLDGVKDGDPKNCPDIFYHCSSRGYTTFTGTLNGVPMSIISIGMGFPMMDFFVREVRAIVEGPMSIVRFGTCGGLKDEVPEGSIVVASGGAVAVTRDPDAFQDDGNKDYYRITRHPALSDPELSSAVSRELCTALGDEIVVHGMNASADSFYSSQGRSDIQFDDRGQDIVEKLCKAHPTVTSMEMETFHLLDLARCCNGCIKATAASIIVANRHTGCVVDGLTLKHLESTGGAAVMRALASTSL